MNTSNQDEAEALRAEIRRLQRLVFVPGMLKCAKCRFVLISSNLNMRNGTITPNDTTEACSNGCGPLWKVTERDAGNEMVDRCEEQVLRAVAAERRVEAMGRALERARTILGNMAQEREGAIFGRWPIHHEPLRGDARRALPQIEAALAEPCS